MSNKLDKSYTDLLQDILDNGITKQDRTGTGTISVFGRQIRHNMKDGFPLLTTKKMPFKTIVTELLWFLRGDTNIKYLVDNNCHIWDGDAYKNYKTKTEIMMGHGFHGTLLSQEEFINKIKTDDEFAKTWGELGPIYGKQWRKWEVNEPKEVLRTEGVTWPYEPNPHTYQQRVGTFKIKQTDQITNLINDLKTNPDSRRLMVNAWNVGELDQMVLPPCHYGFQVYTRELSLEEKVDWLNKNYPMYDLGNWTIERLSDSDYLKDVEFEYNTPTRAISLMWNQRSVDTFLGLPFNIASYGLLLEIIAKQVNMVPDELIGNLGDVHLYSNHIEQAKEQIGREYTLEERINIASTDIHFDPADFGIGDGISTESMHATCDLYGAPRHTREPFPLPTLKINPNNEMRIGGGIFTYDKIDFEVENYQSHIEIKAPLSN